MSDQIQQMQTAQLARLSLDRHSKNDDYSSGDVGNSANSIPPAGLEGGSGEGFMIDEQGEGVFGGINSGELLSFIKSAGGMDNSLFGDVGLGTIFRLKGVLRKNFWSQVGGNMSPFKMSVGAALHGMGMEGKEFSLPPSLAFGEGVNMSPGLSATRADSKTHGQSMG